MKVYLVGGTLRDHVLDKTPRSKDFDFAVEADSFEHMLASLQEDWKLKVWQSLPEFVTVRGKLDLRHVDGNFGGLLPENGVVDADFTLCREEAQYRDHRHPSSVTPTDLYTDLGRRDFTVNAMAVDQHGVWVDPFGGSSDARGRMLDSVGSLRNRFEEDPLRVMRALRFMVTHDLAPSARLNSALMDYTVCSLLTTLPVERVQQELEKACRANWRSTMLLLVYTYPSVGYVLSNAFPKLWMKPSLEAR